MKPRPRLPSFSESRVPERARKPCAFSEHYDIAHFSTGDLLPRGWRRLGTSFGLKAKEFMDAGELVPDDIVIGVVRGGDRARRPAR